MTKNQNPFRISKGAQFRIILLFILLALGLRCILPFSSCLAILILGVVIVGGIWVRTIGWIVITIIFSTGALWLSHTKVEQIERYARMASLSVTALSKTPQTVKVLSEPSIEDNRTRFDGSFLDGVFPSDFKARVTINGSFPKVRMEDTVVIKGKAHIPENKEEETFDYVRFLAKDNIFLEFKAYGLESHVSSTSSSIPTLLLQSRIYLEKTINRLWPGDVGGLISGILIGSKNSITQKTSDAFRITGLSHIVAISGFNITIIIVFIFSLLSWVPKNMRITIAALFIGLFVLFVGASAAVVRAGIMGLISLFALYSERKSHIITSLLLSAVSMTLANPMTLLYDIGFELSFLAVLGLVYGDLFFGFLKKMPEAFGIREALMGTLSAQVTTLPITLYYFGSLSLISPLANILVTPFIPLAMLLGFISVLTTFIPFGGFLVLCFQITTGLLTSIIIQITHFLAEVPYASIEITLFKNLYVLLGAYIGIVVAIVMTQRKSVHKKAGLSPPST